MRGKSGVLTTVRLDQTNNTVLLMLRLRRRLGMRIYLRGDDMDVLKTPLRDRQHHSCKPPLLYLSRVVFYIGARMVINQDRSENTRVFYIQTCTSDSNTYITLFRGRVSCALVGRTSHVS